MANLNKVMLIGRLTRDPEVRQFGQDNSVAKFGFAVDNRRKDQSGNWVNDPVFLEVDAFGKLAGVVEQYCQKGRQIFIEGRLKLDQWTTNDGQKRSQVRIIADNIQFLESKGDGQGQREQHSAPAQPAANPPSQPAQQPQANNAPNDGIPW